ncbi:flippase [Paenibacillus sp. PK3_47]|uniref:flippase n=1 Tax=Paenibacillus sp. PK3_47 TaxID=2072642 RepID=UPI00201DE317|nr:flippase [Paenibacillus sp. PK3_47]UQZ33121.1 flippase [Paenibacillus sp. PK3_47]
MKEITKNYLYNVSYQILNIILPLITIPYLSRVIGPEMLGKYSYTQSIAYYFVVIAMLGLNNYGNKTIASVKDNNKILSKTFLSIYVIQLISSLIVIFFYILFIFFTKDESLLLIIWLIYVCSTAFDINWFYFGLEKFKLTVVRNMIIKVISVLLIFLFVHSKEDVWVYALITALSALISQAVLWVTIKKYITFSLVKFIEVKKHVLPIITLFIPVIAVSIYTIMDKIMLGKLSGMEETGYFDSAQRIMIVPTSLITALGTVMLPRISNLIAKNETSKINLLISNSMLYSSVTSIAISSGLAAISPIFTPIFFGKNFIPTSDIMIILSISVIFIAWANVIRTQYLIPNNYVNVYIISVIIGALVNLIANLLLIPSLGAKGAAIGTVIAEFTVMIYQMWVVRLQLKISSYLKDSIPFFVIGVAMFFLVRLIGQYFGTTVVSLIIQIVVGFLFYLSLSAIYFLLNKEKLEMIKYKKRSEIDK